MRDKPIRYSAHLEGRLALRQIDRGLPAKVIREAQGEYLDTETGYRIALAEVPYRKGRHLMMVAFDEVGEEITAITIHPLEERDVESKLKTGRWTA